MQKLEIHVFVHSDESLALLKDIRARQIQQGERLMALSSKMQEFVNASTAAFSAAGESLNNISADIQKLLAGGSLSTEDAAALDAVTDQLNNLKTALAEAAAVVPE